MVVIDIIGWEFPIISQYEREFEDCEMGNYKINYRFLDAPAAKDRMLRDSASGDPVFELYQGSNRFIHELASVGSLMPLNDLISTHGEQFGLDEIDSTLFDFASIDGRIYAIPGVSNTQHLFYNERILDDLGIEVPTTFDEAFEACAAIQQAGYDVGFVFMLSAGWAWQIEFDSVLGALGERAIDPLTGRPNFNTAAGAEAAGTLERMLRDCGGRAAGRYTTDDLQAAFQTGEIVLGHTWASRAAAMDDPKASTEVGNIAFAPALSMASGGTLAAPAYFDAWGIPAGTEPDVAEAAFLALMAATDRESQTAAAQFGNVTRDGVSHVDGPRNGEVAIASLIGGRGPDLTHPAAEIARQKLSEALVEILEGTSVGEALDMAEKAYLAEAAGQGLIN